MCLFSFSVLPKGTKAPGDLARGKGRGPERLPDLLKGYMETRVIKGMAVDTDTVSGAPCDALGGPGTLELVLAFLTHF